MTSLPVDGRTVLTAGTDLPEGMHPVGIVFAKQDGSPVTLEVPAGTWLIGFLGYVRGTVDEGLSNVEADLAIGANPQAASEYPAGDSRLVNDAGDVKLHAQQAVTFAEPTTISALLYTNNSNGAALNVVGDGPHLYAWPLA